MTMERVPRNITSRLAWTLIMCLGLLLTAVPVGAQSVDEPDASPVPNEPGGIVTPTEAVEPSPEPVEGAPTEPASTPDGDNEGALAPGFVTVVVWTSDGNPLPTDASLCVGRDCRPVGGGQNGIKVEFDKVPAGWQGVQVSRAAPYHDFAGSVLVNEGVGSRVEATLLVAVEQRPRDSVDEVPANGPSGRDVVVADSPAEQASVEREMELSVVRRLPSTGTGETASASPWWAVSGVLAMVAGAFGVRQRCRQIP